MGADRPVTDVHARAAPSGWADWLRWARAAGGDDDAVVEMLLADAGELLTFALVSGTRV